MAKKKKRKAKRKAKRKVSRKSRRVRTRTVKKMKQEKAEMPKRTAPAQAAHTLAMAGGIIILIAVVLALFLGNQISFVPESFNLNLIASAVCGILVLVAVAFVKKMPKGAAMVIGLFSILAWIPYPHGLVFGPVLSLIGAIILLMRK